MRRQHLVGLVVVAFLVEGTSACGPSAGGGAAGTGGGGGGGGSPGSGVDVSDPPPSTSTPEGVAIGTPVTMTIDAAGGTITSDDGRCTVTVPPGAVASPTVFSVEMHDNLMATGVGLAYKIGPAGVTFNPPLGVEFVLSPDDIDGIADTDWLIGYQPAAGQWFVSDPSSPLVPLNAALGAGSPRAAAAAPAPSGGKLKGSLPGGGIVVAGAKVWMAPRSKVISVRDRFSLVAVGVGPTGASFTLLVLDGHANVSGWAVNGIPGGNDAAGKILQEAPLTAPDIATYVAPATVPSPATVVVSAIVTYGGRKVTVSSKVTIVHSAGYIDMDADAYWRTVSECSTSGGRVSLIHQVVRTRRFRHYIINLDRPNFLFGGAAEYQADAEIPVGRVSASLMVTKDCLDCGYTDYSWTALPDSVVVVGAKALLQPISGVWQLSLPYLEFNMAGVETATDNSFFDPPTSSCTTSMNHVLTSSGQGGFTFQFGLASLSDIPVASAAKGYVEGNAYYEAWFGNGICPPGFNECPLGSSGERKVMIKYHYRIPYAPPP